MMAVLDGEPDPRAIGDRLRGYRVRAGLTRAQLAARVGRSPSWIARAERGELRLDRLSILHQLARVLEVPLGELIGVSALGGGHRSRDVGRALRTQGAATVRVAGAQLDAGRRRTVAVAAAAGRTCGPAVSGAATAAVMQLRALSRSARHGLAVALMGMILGVAWVIAHLGRLSSSATTHHRRSAFLTVSAVLVSTALIATVTIGLGGASLSRSPYNELPFTTPSPAGTLKPLGRTPAARQPAPIALVPLAHLPAAVPVPAPARPVVAPAAAAPDPATPRVAPVTAGTGALKPVTGTLGQTVGAVTGAVKPVTQAVGQTVGAVNGAVKPVTQTVGNVVQAAQPVTHVVTSLGSVLRARGDGPGGPTALGGVTPAQHRQASLPGFGLPLRSLIGSWTQAFTHPFGTDAGSRAGGGTIVQNLGGRLFLP